jgi:hypothetical protein
MSLKDSRVGEVLYGPAGVPNNISSLSTRVFSTTDSAYDFYNRSKIFHAYLYFNINSTIAQSAAPAFYVGPCNEITLQLIGTITATVYGSLDGTTFVTANVVASSDGFIRIQSKYRYLQVSVPSVTGPASVYMMIS